MSSIETATFGGGCFWCTEAIFKRLAGVVSVKPGYSGGHIPNPTYEEVSSGLSGHAESIQVTFDPSVIPFVRLLEIFFKTHDPTTLNQQGADIGTQYRSAVFYHGDAQKKIAQKYKTELDKTGIFKNPIVTEITPYTSFYEADEQHKDFYEKNRMQPYCLFVVDPKLEKLRELFPSNLKK